MNNALYGFTKTVPTREKKEKIIGSLPFSIIHIFETGFQTNLRQKGNQFFGLSLY
jgi:hypothetical protein